MVLVIGSPSMSDSVSTRRGERVLTPAEVGVIVRALDLALITDESLQVLDPNYSGWGDDGRRDVAELAADLREAIA
jgi:hypothetical protein